MAAQTIDVVDANAGIVPALTLSHHPSVSVVPGVGVELDFTLPNAAKTADLAAGRLSVALTDLTVDGGTPHESAEVKFTLRDYGADAVYLRAGFDLANNERVYDLACSPPDGQTVIQLPATPGEQPNILLVRFAQQQDNFGVAFGDNLPFSISVTAVDVVAVLCVMDGFVDNGSGPRQTEFCQPRGDTRSSPGDHTCNKPRGLSKFAAGHNTLRITNNLVHVGVAGVPDTDVTAQMQQSDGTLHRVERIEVHDGYFDIVADANATGTPTVVWNINNPSY